MNCFHGYTCGWVWCWCDLNNTLAVCEQCGSPTCIFPTLFTVNMPHIQPHMHVSSHYLAVIMVKLVMTLWCESHFCAVHACVHACVCTLTCAQFAALARVQCTNCNCVCFQCTLASSTAIAKGALWDLDCVLYFTNVYNLPNLACLIRYLICWGCSYLCKFEYNCS